jgi:hypothetical protein
MLDLDICSSFSRNGWRKHQPRQPDCSDLPTADPLPRKQIDANLGTILTSEQSAISVIELREECFVAAHGE